MNFPHVFGTAMELPPVMLTLGDALTRADHDPGQAALDDDAIRAWVGCEPEVRSCILLSAAWLAGRHPSPTIGPNLHPDVEGYVEDLHKYAAAFDVEQIEEFHGAGFPAMPLPGRAGALASSLGFDRDELAVSLSTALVLLAAGWKAEQ